MATAGALHILAGNRGSHGCDPMLGREGVVLQWGGCGQPRPQVASPSLCIDTCPLSLPTPLPPILTKSLVTNQSVSNVS